MKRIVIGSMLGVLSGFFVGCACKSKSVGTAADSGANIPLEQAGPLKDVNFAFDSSKLDSRAMAIIRENADWLKANPNVKVEIEGHCDERGTNEYNMALGWRRAKACYSALINAGIDKNRLSTISYGEERPLDPRSNEEAWAKNRRCFFRVIK
ncbi:MAG: peptidoglycan-associated lipoprotein Pal [Deltaproteobacteria bacterium]|nr:peptidoglycan-associated lipoprotein Pal [Deltaproteobacteria bacterium]MCX7953294.1 peptidoglycan-associated lipoprotein Pal [Deltaproteobacteria bacterium]